MANKVFQDSSSRKRLEAIVHPEVRRLYSRTKKAALATNPALLVYMVPLLFESGLDYSDLKKTIVVSAPREECLRRIIARDGISRDLAERKFNSQIPPAEKEKKGDFVLYNDGDLAALEGKVRTLYGELINL